MENNLNNKVIINVCVTGGEPPKHKNPNIPTTPQEIADDVYRVWKAGASIVHLHMNDENYHANMDRDMFEETIRLIRAHEDCDIIINCTSAGTYEPLPDEERMKHFMTIPQIEMGSFDAGTMNWGCDCISENSPAFLEKLGKVYQEHDIVPEVEVFDMGMMGNTKYYLDHGVLDKRALVQFVLGVLGGMDATVENLQYLVNHLPAGTPWSATGIGGRGHLPIMMAAIAMGGHIRVGLEDNIYYAPGQLATNTMLVERAAQMVRLAGKEVATPSEARQILGIKPLVR